MVEKIWSRFLTSRVVGGYYMPFVDGYVVSAHPPLPLHSKVPRPWALDTYSTVYLLHTFVRPEQRKLEETHVRIKNSMHVIMADDVCHLSTAVAIQIFKHNYVKDGRSVVLMGYHRLRRTSLCSAHMLSGACSLHDPKL